MKCVLIDLAFLKESVEDTYGNEESLLVELKLVVNFDHPVDQHVAHSIVYLLLVFHEVTARKSICLTFVHEFLDVSSILAKIVWIAYCFLVGFKESIIVLVEISMDFIPE